MLYLQKFHFKSPPSKVAYNRTFCYIRLDSTLTFSLSLGQYFELLFSYIVLSQLISYLSTFSSWISKVLSIFSWGFATINYIRFVKYFNLCNLMYYKQFPGWENVKLKQKEEDFYTEVFVLEYILRSYFFFQNLQKKRSIKWKAHAFYKWHFKLSNNVISHALFINILFLLSALFNKESGIFFQSFHSAR